MSEKIKICPRCGQPYQYIESHTVGGRTYLYAVHGREGKKKIRCYLGPAGSYEYVSRTHDIDFRGYADKDRYIKYLDEIIEFLTENEKSLESRVSEFSLMLKLRILSRRIERITDERLEKFFNDVIVDVEATIDALNKVENKTDEVNELIEKLKDLYNELKIMGKGWRFLKIEVLENMINKYNELVKKAEKYI
jgi:hypothetical protein